MGVAESVSSWASPFLPFVIAITLSVQGLRRGSLSPSGALCAFVVGFCMFSGPLRAPGITMIVFYLVGSRATRYGKQRKAKLEDGNHGEGYRTAWQVICNSFSALIAWALWNVLFNPSSILSKVVSYVYDVNHFPYDAGAWCPLSTDASIRWSRGLLFACLGHFACCMGDTLASEVGILSTRPPILITTLKTVPPGTNGAVSRLGVLASVFGGLLMGLTMATSVILENTVCRRQSVDVLVTLVVYGAFAGFFGSLIDSLMGATIQRTRYAVDSKLILHDDSDVAAGTEIKVISGLNILSNNQVNFISSMLTAAVMGLMDMFVYVILPIKRK